VAVRTAKLADPPIRVSTLELFFDLVFVFTITQVMAIMVDSPDGRGVAQAAITMSIIYWMYGGYAWLTNSGGPDTLTRRVILLAGMAAFFVCSLAVPSAFDEGGLAFAVGYLLVVLVHAAGFIVYAGAAAIRPVERLLSWNLVSAGLILGAAWAHGPADWLLWGAAVVVQLITPIVIRVGQNFRINAAHFGERHGLVILIVLGESLVSVALASEHQRVGLRLTIGVLVGLALATVMWWMYFGGDDERAVSAMEAAPAEKRPVWAITGYFLAHYVMIFGILMVAAGTHLGVDDLFARTSAAGAWIVACGGGLFALGSAAFRQALHFAPPLSRAVGGLACLAAYPIGRYGSATAELAAVAVVFGVTLLLESRPDGEPDVTPPVRSEKMAA
jgi:low temperature requirement protein LtrA